MAAVSWLSPTFLPRSEFKPRCFHLALTHHCMSLWQNWFHSRPNTGYKTWVHTSGFWRPRPQVDTSPTNTRCHWIGHPAGSSPAPGSGLSDNFCTDALAFVLGIVLGSRLRFRWTCYSSVRDASQGLSAWTAPSLLAGLPGTSWKAALLPQPWA